ncbi:MAG: hypothetical protein CMJ89_08760 [Planctomycetes bacterium]|jgi:hypothetical protein|nr:hypothetical protein [Planctomycetota bacterium]
MADYDVSTCLFHGGKVSSGGESAWELARQSFCGSPNASEKEWAWRFENAPDGTCVALVTDSDQRVVSRVLGTRKLTLLDGESVFFIRVFDLYNDFEQRQGLARARSLKQCGEAFARSFGGRAPEGHPVIYGVPTRRAHRFGLRHLRWEILRSEAVLRVGPRGLLGPAAPGVEVEEIDRFSDEVDGLCERVGQGRGAVLVRDAARLNHLFCERPGANYTIAAARCNGQLAGYCVYSEGTLCDWIVAPDAMDVAAALCVWGDERARSEGKDGLAASFPESSPEWLLFQRLGFWIHAGDAYTVFRSFHKPYIMSWLFSHWYYTPADID